VETKPYTISYGIGYQTFDLLRGAFSISDRNLFGSGRGLGLQVRGGIREARALLTYTDTNLIFHNTTNTLNLLAEKRVVRPTFAYREYSTYFESERRLSREVGELPLGSPVPAITSLFFRYRFSDITNTGTPTLDPIDRPFRPLHISSVSEGFARDARDNAIDPTRGNYLSTSLEWATTYLGSQTDFLKWYTELRAYQPFERMVFAGAIRAGLARGFRNTLNLPLSQRFFAGGCTTIRGFEQDTCGPVNNQGQPIGGNAMLIMNLENRFPIYGDVGGLAFVDIGNVFKRVEFIDLSQLRYTAGVGIRLKTPIGPLSLDWGYKLDRQVGESPYEFCFSVGNAF